MFSILKSVFGLFTGGTGSSAIARREDEDEDDDSLSGADAWLATYRRRQPQAAAAARLETDTFSDGEAVTVEQPDAAAVRQGIARVASGTSDFLTISRGVGSDEDFLQAARDTDGQFLLEARVTRPGKSPEHFHSRRTVSVEEMTEVVLDYRGGGNRWTEICAWEFGTR